jgi:shikimate kinase
MHISLIGMSGSGKSKWSIKLSELGFKRFCCDDLITKKLASELTRVDGTIMEPGEWMGFPHEPQYKERESDYLACEMEVLSEIIESIEKNNYLGKNIVIDTTGSVIYAGEEILKKLRRCTTVIHFSTPPEAQELMLKAYLTNRRPVLWRDFFRKLPNETNEEALARCYPKLLIHREHLYEQYKDMTIDYYTLNHREFQIEDFMNIVHMNIK